MSYIKRHKFIIFSLVLICSTKAFSFHKCHIKSYNNIYIIESIKDRYNSDFIISSNCPKKIKDKFIKIISHSQDFFNKTYFESIIKESLGDYQVMITPSFIKIQSIKKILDNLFGISDSYVWKEIKAISGKKYLLLSQNEKISLSCDNKGPIGKKNIQIKIYDDHQQLLRNEWIQATLTIKARVLIPKQHMAITNRALNANDFKFSTIDTATPEQYFTRLNNLKFYKINRPIHKDTPIKFSDLVAINLVKIGTIAKVIYRNKSLVLSNQAIPMRSGKQGDIIQLKNIKNNNLIQGKVIDFNKVLVEL